MGLFKSLYEEFKAFAIQGNAVDLAVGVVIGAAFGGVVKSLVADVIMPPLGIITGGLDYTDKVIHLRPEIKDAAGAVVTKAVELRYGNFITELVNFIIVAIAIFAVIKLMNMLTKDMLKSAPPPATPDQLLLTEIRDLLKEKAAKS
jgi:large conductance mechanosensitive channel